MDFYTPEKDTHATESGTRDTALPTVLIIGDSISQGYTGPVRTLLNGRWDVQRPKANCGNTAFGLDMIDQWLGDTHWNIIHFNWGLHDLCYRHPDSTVYGNRDKVNGTRAMSPEEYAENLENLVERLKQSADGLIWATTTVIPPGEAGRFEGDEVVLNQLAEDIMTAHDVPVNDLHALTTTFGPELFWKSCDVHFSEDGYALIARQVANCIELHGKAVREATGYGGS